LVVNPSRKPHDAQASRMSALARLPVFLSLDGKRAVLAGGNPAAVWKAELLSAAGAQVNSMQVDIGKLAAESARRDRHNALVSEISGAPSARSKATKVPPRLQRPRARPACRSM
jgi:hypothetical protein